MEETIERNLTVTVTGLYILQEHKTEVIKQS